MSKTHILYSDGGAELRKSGGSACIIEDASNGERVHIAAFIGGATNNEAEILACLLGLAWLKANASDVALAIEWVCDSEYALKSATQYIHNWKRNGWQTAAKKPVKNQGLWHAYDFLAQGIEVTPHHVRGHTGHPENEACDTLSNWVRENVDMLLEPPDALRISLDGETWYVLDISSELRAIRDSDSLAETAIQSLTEMVGAIDGSGASEDPEARRAAQIRRVAKLREELVDIVSRLDAIDCDEATELTAKLRAIL